MVIIKGGKLSSFFRGKLLTICANEGSLHHHLSAVDGLIYIKPDGANAACTSTFLSQCWFLLTKYHWGAH